MTNTLFISDAYIKQFTPVGGLVEWSDLEPSVRSTQDSYIQDILGSNFYNYIVSQYEAQALTADEIILMEHIKPALAHRGAEQALVVVHYQIKNKGVMTQSGDYAAAIELDEFKYLRNELANRAEFYEKRLSVYLCDNRLLFPQYITDNTDDMKPHAGGYNNCGLSFL
tara:strand:- start:94 stop:597 length:504 start_codon:yes stop_codon:yes gene_type:complete